MVIIAYENGPSCTTESIERWSMQTSSQATMRVLWDATGEMRSTVTIDSMASAP